MRCPFCDFPETNVRDSRSVDENTIIRRRRSCLRCSGRFTTVEHVQLIPLKVLKRTGRMEAFDRAKLMRSLQNAVHKRLWDAEALERVAGSLIRQFETMGVYEISSHLIGEKVMERLKEIDPIAYVRFATIYHQIRNEDELIRILSELKEIEVNKEAEPEPDEDINLEIEAPDVFTLAKTEE